MRARRGLGWLAGAACLLGGCLRADLYPVTAVADGGTVEGGSVADAPVDLPVDAPVDPPVDPPADPPVDPPADPMDRSACPVPILPVGNTSVKIQVGTATRSYVLHVPAAYDGKTPVPLLVDFHGIGSSGWGEIVSSPYPAVTDPEGVIMAFPDGLSGPIGTAWNLGPCCVANVDDLGFARALVAHVQKSACIDPKRIYAVGVLTGAGMVQALACQAADLFAAASSAAFDLLTDTVDDCRPARPISMVLFRGTDDPRVPYAGGLSQLVPGMSITFLGAEATFVRWAQINGCPSTPSGVDARGCRTYAGCGGGAEVVFCSKQGGRDDPGDPAIAWPILKRHTL
jgi:polyhydroxybutyrate depolymerase